MIIRTTVINKFESGGLLLVGDSQGEPQWGSKWFVLEVV